MTASLFERRLITAITERIEKNKYHYVDNSVAYYHNPILDNMAEDKRWFSNCKLPDPKLYVKYIYPEILRQVRYKGYLYQLLCDNYSREILILVALYSLLGHRFVKFPYYRPNTLKLRNELHNQYAVLGNDPVHPSQSGLTYTIQLYKFPLIEKEIICYTTSEFLYQVIYSPQYRYSSESVLIDVEKNDYVFDCGACTGDTSLYFAVKAGLQGRVVSFEPHPSLCKIFNTNLRHNTNISKNIQLMPFATSNKNGKTAFSLCGAGSHIGNSYNNLQQINIPQIKIDDAVQGLGVERVDFIKMDIEGAELASLHGAVETLRHYRPKLAICLYHNEQDFLTIPAFLYGLGLNYRFYLDHHFVNNWETVLYAITE